MRYESFNNNSSTGIKFELVEDMVSRLGGDLNFIVVGDNLAFDVSHVSTTKNYVLFNTGKNIVDLGQINKTVRAGKLVDTVVKNNKSVQAVRGSMVYEVLAIVHIENIIVLIVGEQVGRIVGDKEPSISNGNKDTGGDSWFNYN